MERRLLGDLMKSYNKLERPVSLILIFFKLQLQIYHTTMRPVSGTFKSGYTVNGDARQGDEDC